METHLFSELGVILVVATAMALLMRVLRQPLIIGHILTGLIVGPVVFDIVRSAEVLRLFGEIGIAFLLFSVGLGLNPRVLKTFGMVAVVTGVGQVVFTTAIGLFICLALGLAFVTSLYVAIALAFSSTIIILKIISDKGDTEQLYAKIAVGFLLVQDFIAIFLLFAIPLLTGSGSLGDLLILLAQGVGLGALTLFIAFKVFTHLDRFLSHSQELLFLFANAWGIGIAALFWKIGFSLESGALIAGIGLSALPSRHEISARLTPLRDFFLVLFFILLGTQMALGDVTAVLPHIVILSILVLVGNPLILMIIMGFLGYRKKTSLETGFTVAQISEFSLVLVALGVRLGHVSESMLSMITVIGLVTIFGSTYFMLYADRIYKVLAPYLGIFERKHPIEKAVEHKDHDVFLFGGSRVGSDFIDLFTRTGKDFVVVDYDPDVIRSLRREGIPVEYGDAGDIDLLDELRLEAASLVVSTVPEMETNVRILRAVRRAGERAVFIAVAHTISAALELYGAGADYVILPHFLGAKYASDLAERYFDDVKHMTRLREDHVRHLKKRLARGQEHPSLTEIHL